MTSQGTWICRGIPLIWGGYTQKGASPSQDDIKAYSHFSVAVALGHRAAAKNVAQIENILAPSVIGEGKRAAAQIMDLFNVSAKNEI